MQYVILDKRYIRGGMGKVIASGKTKSKSGSCGVSNRFGMQFIGIESGEVSLVEVGNMFKKSKNRLMAVSRIRDEAEQWFNKALAS